MLELATLLIGALLVVHGLWWLRRGTAGRTAYRLAAIGAVLAAGIGLSWETDLLRRIGFVVLGVGLVIELTAYTYWEGPISRSIWKLVARDPDLEDQLKRRGVSRPPRNHSDRE